MAAKREMGYRIDLQGAAPGPEAEQALAAYWQLVDRVTRDFSAHAPVVAEQNLRQGVLPDEDTV